MEPDKPDSTPVGMNHLPNRLKRLWVLFIFFQIISLIIILISIEVSNYRTKNDIAISLAESLTNDIVVKNYRRITEVLNTSVKDNFNRILLNDLNTGKTLDVSNENFRKFDIKISISNYFDTSKETKISTLDFFYRPLNSLLEILIAWVCLLLCSTYFLRRFRKNLITEYSSNLETAKAKQSAEIAKKVAHDIRSPLSALNMLVKTQTDLNSNENKDIIISVAARISSIAEELLSKSREARSKSSEDSSNLEKIEQTINQIIKEKELEYAQDKRVKLIARNEVGHQKGQIDVDANILKTILSNLINNSIEAIVDDGNIYIEYRTEENKYFIVSVIDFGKGIPPDIIAQLTTKPLTFGDKAKTNSGSGIGVFNSSQILQAAGGKLTIESRLGIGSKFSIWIPMK